VKVFEKSWERVTVFAARMGPSDVARTPAQQRVKVTRSRFHRGQLRGSLGSSEGWGTCCARVSVAGTATYLDLEA
jgi:hypothetical protein